MHDARHEVHGQSLAGLPGGDGEGVGHRHGRGRDEANRQNRRRPGRPGRRLARDPHRQEIGTIEDQRRAGSAGQVHHDFSRDGAPLPHLRNLASLDLLRKGRKSAVLITFWRIERPTARL